MKIYFKLKYIYLNKMRIFFNKKCFEAKMFKIMEKTQ